VLIALEKERVRTGQVSVVNRDVETGLCEMTIDVTLSRNIAPPQIYDALLEIKGVTSVEMQ
jgi:putative Mg2+ transporter-C (MgtC) family protein